ncbi:hypothetical protein MIMGU_mgv1a022142mg [Erythranthe guttata]|uniref:Protein kinase domain-containing protein n=2 Tax=Erythranthe guttata TaxID=4155 RepID=A0A022RI69_ERYGU|nr:hypothetical protein MIMGU_mgv1a022142mg [Erythranthe guttata]
MNHRSFEYGLIQLFYFISLSSSLNLDGFSLLALKASITKDPTQALISWSDSDSTPCSWAGITCDRTHSSRVISISLPNKNLTGYIPSEISALAFLTSLDLSHNSFGGPLPHQITALQTLVHLDVSSNNLNGSLPESLSSLTHLTGTLNLSFNAFSGEIPASFGRFPVMVSLDLRCNNLTGKIPQVESLLNQGPTAFSGNPFLCGFPLSKVCEVQEDENPRFLNIPQKPVNAGVPSNGVVENNKKINGGPLTISVISGVCLVIGVMFVSVWVIKKRWKIEKKLGKENVSSEEVVVVVRSCEEGQKGKFVVMDEGFALELEDLLRASAYVVGKSRSGIVYKVVVGGGGRAVSGPVVVAVRRMSEGDVAWRLKEFEAEMEAIGKVQHPNIVRLRAYYYASDEKLVISDFVRNGSLYNALHGGPGNTLPSSLSWSERLKIAQESAKALTHIHEWGPKKYVHGKIKSSKILLDDNLKPYISGFGLSRLDPKQIPNQGIVGPTKSSLLAYVAPEARAAGSRLTQKCDVYSFGILLLEMLTGQLPVNYKNDGGDCKGIEGLVRKAFSEKRPLSEIIDPSLLHEARAKKQVVATFYVALNCTEFDPELRPKMRSVSDNLDRIKLQ